MICRKDIERFTKTFWSKKGHLLCSTCLDDIDKKKEWLFKFGKDVLKVVFKVGEEVSCKWLISIFTTVILSKACIYLINTLKKKTLKKFGIKEKNFNYK